MAWLVICDAFAAAITVTFASPRWFDSAAQALDRYSRQDFEQAVAKLEAIRGATRKASEYLAVLATAYIALEMSDVGRLLLLRALAQSSPAREDYMPYVKNYCEYYLSVVDGNQGAKIRHLEAALRIDAPPIIWRWLPLS